MNIGPIPEVTYEITQSQVNEIANLLTLIILPKAIYEEDALQMANNVIKNNRNVAELIMSKLPRPVYERGVKL